MSLPICYVVDTPFMPQIFCSYVKDNQANTSTTKKECIKSFLNFEQNPIQRQNCCNTQNIGCPLGSLPSDPGVAPTPRICVKSAYPPTCAYWY